MSLGFLYEGLGTSEYRWIFKECFFFAKFSYSIMRDIIERMITTRCGLALVVETRNAENIGDKATVKKRNGTGIDESNVVISIYFLFFFAKFSHGIIGKY